MPNLFPRLASLSLLLLAALSARAEGVRPDAVYSPHLLSEEQKRDRTIEYVTKPRAFAQFNCTLANLHVKRKPVSSREALATLSFSNDGIRTDMVDDSFLDLDSSDLGWKLVPGTALLVRTSDDMVAGVFSIQIKYRSLENIGRFEYVTVFSTSIPYARMSHVREFQSLIHHLALDCRRKEALAKGQVRTAYDRESGRWESRLELVGAPAKANSRPLKSYRTSSGRR